MGFVLVPVPTDYVLDVMRWVLFRTDVGEADRAGDTMRLARLLEDADDEIRSLLQLVANATLRDEPLRLRDLADELGRAAAEVTAAIEALNEGALEDERPLLEVRNETGVGVHGKTGKNAYVSMRPDLARVARGALRRKAAR